ncbi:MAG: prolyl oligopeptidase family serine peptidase [Pirellulales bacterium]|nr:prolyl oligopeptidase family serine peptidase [Pirellulales bacterium]
MLRTPIYFSMTIILSVASLAYGQESILPFPETRRVDQVDTFHGVEVADPYRWLEEDPRNSSEVAAWIEAQNRLARRYLDAIPSRKMFEERLTKLWNYERYSVPGQTAGKYFFLKNDGLQNQAVLYVADSYSDEGRVLIDPNTWSEDGTISLGASMVSDDGRYLAYLRKESGSDWSTIYVLEIETGRQLEEELLWTRWGNIVWNADSTGFFYTRYPEPEEGQKFQSSVVNPMIYFHRLGTTQDQDELVYQRPDHPTWSFWLQQTDDNQFLVLSIARSTDPQNQVWVRHVGGPRGSQWTPLIEDFENEFEFVGNVGEKFFFLTDYEAPTKRVVSMEIQSPGREGLADVIPVSEATLRGVSLLDNKLVASYLRDVVSQVRVFSLEGSLESEVELPGVGSVSGLGGRETDTETFYAFTSYNTPMSIYRYDLTTGKTEQIRAPQIDFNSADYEVRQAFYESKDGTRVPILVTHRKDIELNGRNPTLLYGYGGFNISLTPGFKVEYAVWMEQGGVVAVPNLRGGGEYGEPWHQAGKKLNKQNVFDDFIAAAEWLIAEGYTSTEKLAVKGGSNGGLLVGAVMTQRPDLFGACLPAVGVMDMLRYQNFTAGHFWRDEFGTVDDPEEFKAIYAYSPYHNIRAGQSYPATMVTTADTDDRVVPMHSFKFGAALQRAQAGPAPTLLRIEKRAGHGAGTPISKRIKLAADNWAFLWKSLGMEDEQ